MSEHPYHCATCGTPIAAPDATPRLCQECGKKTGLPRPAPAVRPPSPCQRCQHRELVRVQMRERTSADGGETNHELARPFALTWARGEEFKALLSFEKIPSARPDLSRPFGLLEAYVCRACGYTEIFARDPQHIPIGPAYGTEIVVAPGGGYR